MRDDSESQIKRMVAQPVGLVTRLTKDSSNVVTDTVKTKDFCSKFHIKVLYFAAFLSLGELNALTDYLSIISFYRTSLSDPHHIVQLLI